MDKTEKITQAVKEWMAVRDFFAAAISCATSPEQLEKIIMDIRWEKRRKAAAENLLLRINEVN